METTAKLYSLTFKSLKTYIFALFLIVGNILFPQICHLTPYGGPTLLPIYFFTLIAGYKYGLRVGLLTALLSPIANNLLFGMPPTSILPLILIKSGLLAVTSALAAHYSKKISLGAIFFAVIGYQLIGTAIEWGILGNFYDAIQDFRIGVPGMLIQIFGGYTLLKAIAKI
ncbi:ECF transporter S component [uncultured Bacteroides sp.]|uniref:ECF transporter S component n=1 Tax=uncultured Bacteroides sp. TaxID=162156 RepID=UPI002AAC2F25|nr:ECF transporter S component [uncultured Bacteroides sp.]